MTFVFCLVWAEVNIRPAAIGFQHNDDEAKYSPAMASKTRRFEILLVITIIINVYVIVFVLNTQKSDVDIELKSKVELLRSLSELKHALRINQSSLVVNSQFSEETTVSEVKERHIGIEGKWASFHENEWKAVNTTESRHANTALQDYCPEGGENLGKDYSFYSFRTLAVAFVYFCGMCRGRLCLQSVYQLHTELEWNISTTAYCGVSRH